jgi:hypothetical protein
MLERARGLSPHCSSARVSSLTQQVAQMEMNDRVVLIGLMALQMGVQRY